MWEIIPNQEGQWEEVKKPKPILKPPKMAKPPSPVTPRPEKEEKKPWWVGPFKRFLQAERLMGGKDPEMARVIHEKGKEFLMGAAKLPEELIKRIGMVEKPPPPKDIGEALTYYHRTLGEHARQWMAPMAKEFIKEEAKTIKKIAKHPIKTALEEPGEYIDAGITATWVLGGALGGISKAARAMRTANQVWKHTRGVRGLPQKYTRINLLDDQAKLSRKLVKKLPDELRSQGIAEMSAKATPVKDIPDPSAINDYIVQLDTDQGMRAALEALKITGQGTDTKWLESTRNFFSMLNEYRHSPSEVLGKYGRPGTKIYEITDVMDLGGLEFLHSNTKAYVKATKHARRGDINYGVFRSINEGLEISDIIKMTPKEAKVHGFTAKELTALKKNPAAAHFAKVFYESKYEEFIRDYGRMKVGKAREPEIWDAANKYKKIRAGKTVQPVYRKTLYRGTTQATPVDAGAYGKGTYFTPDKKYAESFGLGPGGRVMESEVFLDNPWVTTPEKLKAIREPAREAMRQKLSQQIPRKPLSERMKLADDAAGSAIRLHAEKMGYDGIIIKRAPKPEEVVVFYPQRSVQVMRTTAEELAGAFGADIPRAEVLTRGFSPEELKVFNIYKRRIIDYIPHLFDRNEVLGKWKMNLARLQKQIEAEKAKGGDLMANKKLAELNTMQDRALSSIQKIQGGEPLLFDTLPGEYQFRYFKHREGAPGYSVDAARAFKSYLAGIKKKIFDETAIEIAVQEYAKLPPQGQAYAKWYLRDYMGYNRKRQFDSLYGTVKSIQWIRTLGLNPRSAIVNLTQRINTIADFGPTASLDGWRFGLTKQGRALFEESGIGRTIPQVLMEGNVANNALEGLRAVAGFMFSAVEKGNQKLAFSTGYRVARGKGLPHESAMRAGRLAFEKQQFRYGRVGMPRMLRGGKGVALQFWSFPLKQIEFLTKLYKEDPWKFFSWVALAEGGEYTVDEFLGLDLSNALGFGMNYGELFEAFEALASGDVRKASLRLAKTQEGGGIFPYGLGPTVGLIGALVDVFKDVNHDVGRLARELMPVSIGRAIQVTRALIQGETSGTAKFGGAIAQEFDIPEADLPLYDLRAIPMDPTELFKKEQTEMLLGRETLPQLLARVFLAKPQVETEAYQEKRDIYLEEQVRRAIQAKIVDLLGKQQWDEAISLMLKYDVIPSEDALKSSLLRQVLTPLERAILGQPKRGEAFRKKIRK
jgi:hypothetical protein